MHLETKDVIEINEALESGLILKFGLNPNGGHRTVILVDPMEKSEYDAKVYGFGNDGTLEMSLITASESYLKGGKLAGPIYGCCAIEHGCQSFSDRFITAGGNARAYQKDNKNKLTLRGYNGNYLIRLMTGPDFAETANFMGETLSKRKDIFMGAWDSIPEFQKNDYQNPEDLFLRKRA